MRACNVPQCSRSHPMRSLASPASRTRACGRPARALALQAQSVQLIPSTASLEARIPDISQWQPTALADVQVHAQPLLDAAEGLEAPIQLSYLLSLLGILGAGAYLVVRQVLIRRELDESAKSLGERIRTGEAACEDYYELGVILTRKKLFTQATKNLEKAKKLWDGEESELAQVHNALGFCYINLDKTDAAISEYERAVALQPGYVTAWNNLGDAFEKSKQWRRALTAYQEALSYAPNNKIAQQRSEFCKTRAERLGV